MDRLRDAVLDQHAPGVAGDQRGVTGLEVVGDQGGTKTLEVANKVASAYKDLAIEIQGTEAGTEWDEASFFAVLEQDNGPEVAATARRIYEWSQQHMPSIWWGKGSQQGGFIPGIDHNGKWHQLVEVWTNGYVEIQFQYMKKSPPFDQAASRDELRKRLNALDGVSLDDDTIDRRPGNDQQASIARDLAQALGAKKPLAVFDLETTGTYVRSDRIVEIAILRIDVDRTATYKVRTFNPEMPIPADATAVHGISDEDVAAEPTFRQVARSLAEFLEGCDLRGFNLRWFDVPILQEEFARAGVKFEVAGRSVIDACAIFKMNERRNLAAAYALYCEKDMEEAHSAGADTLATMEILLKQMKRYSELPRTAAELHEYCRDPSWVDEDGKFKWRGGDAVFGFGKHAGAPLREVAETAPDYLDWMIGADFPDETLAILRNAKEGSFPDPGAGADTVTPREENQAGPTDVT